MTWKIQFKIMVKKRIHWLVKLCPWYLHDWQLVLAFRTTVTKAIYGGCSQGSWIVYWLRSKRTEVVMSWLWASLSSSHWKNIIVEAIISCYNGMFFLTFINYISFVSFFCFCFGFDVTCHFGIPTWGLLHPLHLFSQF